MQPDIAGIGQSVALHRVDTQQAPVGYLQGGANQFGTAPLAAIV